MTVISLQFTAGRYHATPWGRNVNEGEAEWPPAPFRLARALYDVWKRRFPDVPAERMTSIFRLLAGKPVYSLPPVTRSHLRLYLDTNKKGGTNKQLVFDPFIVIDRKKKVLMKFDVGLGRDDRLLLDELVRGLSYFGRSESWVRAGLHKPDHSIEWNCTPLDENTDIQPGKVVRVACLIPENDYVSVPVAARNNGGEDLTWLKALKLSTNELQKMKVGDHPCLMRADYNDRSTLMHTGLEPKPFSFIQRIRCVRYALSSRVLPPVQETVSLAERLRKKLMGIHKNVQNSNPEMVSSLFSGKDQNGNPLKDHTHAMYLPLDEDRDGRLDHVMILVKKPFGPDELTALDRLRSIRQPDGRPDVKMVLTSMSDKIEKKAATQWISVTPFVTARHYRKGRGSYEDWIKGELVRECFFHGMPEPVEITMREGVNCMGRTIRWMDYLRGRGGERPLRGHGFAIRFEKPVAGPFALGSLCHYGLGLFDEGK